MDACTCQLGCMAGAGLALPASAAFGIYQPCCCSRMDGVAGGRRQAAGRPVGMRGRTEGGMRKNVHQDGRSVRGDHRVSINSYERCVRYLSVLSTDIPHDIHRQQPLDPGSSYVFPRTDQQPVDARRRIVQRSCFISRDWPGVPTGPGGANAKIRSR